MADGQSLTEDLVALATGAHDRAAAERRVYELAYAELRRLAASLMRRERHHDALRPTELVHEAYLRLSEGQPVSWEGRAHFFGSAARAMRCILVDHARRRVAAKRGGACERISLHTAELVADSPALDLIVLDDALTRLSSLDDRTARTAELKLIGGLTIREIATVLDVSERTVSDDWAFANRWLRRELTQQ